MTQNLIAGAVVYFGRLVINRLLPGLDETLLGLVASVAAIFVLFIIHYFRSKGLYTSESFILPLGFTLGTILLSPTFYDMGHGRLTWHSHDPGKSATKPRLLNKHLHTYVGPSTKSRPFLVSPDRDRPYHHGLTLDL